MDMETCTSEIESKRKRLQELKAARAAGTLLSKIEVDLLVESLIGPIALKTTSQFIADNQSDQQKSVLMEKIQCLSVEHFDVFDVRPEVIIRKYITPGNRKV